MNVKVEDVSSVKKKLSFEIDAKVVDSEIEKAYKSVARTAKIKGFRQGKIPRKVLEKHYAPQVQEQVLGALINNTYFKAIEDENIYAVSQPEVNAEDPVEKGKAFVYEATVEIKPEVEVKDYEGFSLKKEVLEFDETFVDKRLEEMLEAQANLEVTTRKKAREGDSVVMDFEGFVDGVPFEGGKAEGHVLELGSGTFIPGFEDQLIGMKREMEKDVEVTFPEEYGNKDLAGKPAVFKVLVHEIKEKVLPKLNDAFAKEVGGESLEDLRGKIEDNFRQQEASRIENQLRESLMAELCKRNPVEIPEAMVDRQIEHMLKDTKQRMQAQGMSLEMLGLTDEVFKERYREEARVQVQGSLLLEAFATQEGIAVDEADINDKIEELAGSTNAPIDAIKKYYATEQPRQNLTAQIMDEKTVKAILEKSDIVEVSKEELVEQESDEDKE